MAIDVPSYHNPQPSPPAPMEPPPQPQNGMLKHAHRNQTPKTTIPANRESNIPNKYYNAAFEEENNRDSGVPSTFNDGYLDDGGGGYVPPNRKLEPGQDMPKSLGKSSCLIEVIFMLMN